MLLQVLHHIRKRNRRRAVEYQVELHITEMLLDSTLILALHHQRADALLHHIGLLDIQCANF